MISAVLPIIALAFTIASFWWLYLRRGHLEVVKPYVYAGYATGTTMRIRLQLAFYNTGARPILVSNMQLTFATDPRPSARWITVRSTLKPQSDDVADWAKPFSIQGRNTYHVCAEFGDEEDTPWNPHGRESHIVRLEAQLHPKTEWVTIGSFDWWPAQDMSSYVAYRNERTITPPATPNQ